MLCSRPSIKDVSLPRWREHRKGSSCDDDPLSPRISCMGQVKRNNKIAGIGFSTSHRLSLTSKSSTTSSTPSSSTSPSVVKYSKLKKLFSSKNLKTTTTTPTTTAAATISSCGAIRQQQRVNRNQRCGRNENENENVVSISIENMDPPLPVIKKVHNKLEEGSLWQRRYGGNGIKSLQVQQIHHHPRICLQPTSV
ncbi:hypothetical protein RIF29_11803 [Crotalaria pallida]|uniref:Uncharacterized protein n=1 Tax=Crotalaria pallida TaxID=3830 RepID=A0AAN9P0C0_CROPI